MDQAGILLLKYSSTADVPLARMAALGLRKGLPSSKSVLIEEPGGKKGISFHLNAHKCMHNHYFPPEVLVLKQNTKKSLREKKFTCLSIKSKQFQDNCNKQRPARLLITLLSHHSNTIELFRTNISYHFYPSGYFQTSTAHRNSIVGN